MSNFSLQRLLYRAFSFCPGGGLQCNKTGSNQFFKNLHNLFRKKFAFQYPVSEFLDYVTIPGDPKKASPFDKASDNNLLG